MEIQTLSPFHVSHINTVSDGGLPATQNHCFPRRLRQSRVPEQKDQPVTPHGWRNSERQGSKPLPGTPHSTTSLGKQKRRPRLSGATAAPSSRAAALAALGLDARPPRWDLPQPGSEGVFPAGVRGSGGQDGGERLTLGCRVNCGRRL